MRRLAVLRPKFSIAITFCIAVFWYSFMSYTPNTVPDLESLTLAYKIVQGEPIFIDIYPPSLTHNYKVNAANPNGDEDLAIVPAVLYFHGGGLTVGNRKSWFPQWMQS